ncbi:uncharacterized protein RJT21DRAFT_2826 [Scheffersomyces amazonensis]|uniref:uncharacterized protein n=1 Tax=Scheffersomyces amazonensis TaxID=1078765 RepID=UPI00315CD9E6
MQNPVKNEYDDSQKVGPNVHQASQSRSPPQISASSSSSHHYSTPQSTISSQRSHPYPIAATQKDQLLPQPQQQQPGPPQSQAQQQTQPQPQPNKFYPAYYPAAPPAQTAYYPQMHPPPPPPPGIPGHYQYAPPPNSNGAILQQQVQQPYPQMYQQTQLAQPQLPPPGVIPPAPIEVEHIPSQGKKRPVSASIPPTRNLINYPRKRALTACDSCRLKKIKCDNIRPRCGSCTKNGNTNCHYRTDDQSKDNSNGDSGSTNIMKKLDTILKDLNDLKKNAGLPITTPEEEEESFNNERKRPRVSSELKFDDCFWDMSLTSILRWRSFKHFTGETAENISAITNQLVKDYNINDIPVIKTAPLAERIVIANALDTLIKENLSTIINSFFVNCFTKIPILDTLEFFEILELYKCLIAYDNSLTFMSLLETYDASNPSTDNIPKFVYDALKASNLEDTPYRRLAYRCLCESVPVILAICALGVISTSIQLDNLAKFNTSFEERSSIATGCLSNDSSFIKVPANLPRDRSAIAFLLINYATFLESAFPDAITPSSLNASTFNLLLSQYYLYIMCPLRAYRYISNACQHVMYFIIQKNVNNTFNAPSIDTNKRDIVERLFWMCLKLECELRLELSPYVPLSGITQVTPPSSFPKIPDPMTLSIKEAHSEACIRLANKYDDERTWYYFLTEIAVRKVDNKMCDEMYSFENVNNNTWDTEQFANETVWSTFIKYLNQYNGIINSLNPQIRNFVLQEVNVDQIHRRMKKKYEKKQAKVSVDSDIFDSLDDFLIDDDLLLRAQSESIMFIKTRIVLSKLLLFRPLVYLVLEDKISVIELLEATLSVVSTSTSNSSANTLNSVESPDSLSSNSNPLTGASIPSDAEMEMDYFNIINAPLFYQKQYPDEDFSDLIEYPPKENGSKSDDESEENSEENFKLKDISSARVRIMRIFVQNLISLPKLNIPKLGSYRHPGSWYYLRNLFIGNVFQFLLYKKITESLKHAITDETFKHLTTGLPDISSPTDLINMVNVVLSKESIITGYEHSLIIFRYWMEESKDLARVMKKALPEHAKLSKDSKECIQECVSEFISFITSQAIDKCGLEKRKTLNGEDILWAMFTLGFENYSETLKIYLAKYRQYEQEQALMKPPRKRKQRRSRVTSTRKVRKPKQHVDGEDEEEEGLMHGDYDDHVEEEEEYLYDLEEDEDIEQELEENEEQQFQEDDATAESESSEGISPKSTIVTTQQFKQEANGMYNFEFSGSTRSKAIRSKNSVSQETDILDQYLMTSSSRSNSQDDDMSTYHQYTNKV